MSKILHFSIQISIQLFCCTNENKVHLLTTYTLLQSPVLAKCLAFPKAMQCSFSVFLVARCQGNMFCPFVQQQLTTACVTWDRVILYFAQSSDCVCPKGRTPWKQHTSVWAEVVSRLTHMMSKPFYSSCKKKNTRCRTEARCKDELDWVIVYAELCVCVLDCRNMSETGVARFDGP